MTDPAAPQQPVPPQQPAAPQPQYAAPAPAAPLTEAEDKQWASFAHLGGIIGLLPSLIIFLVFKDRGARTRVEAKEALNWQITFTAAVIILSILNGILGAVFLSVYLSTGADLSFLTFIVGLLIFAVYVANLVFSILGFVKVNGGGSYRYPVAIRLVK